MTRWSNRARLLQLTESYLTGSLVRQILGRIERLAWHPAVIWNTEPGAGGTEPGRRGGLRMIGGAVDRRPGLLFVALAAIIHGSLGVTTKGVFNVAATNAYSITLLRAIVALLACLAICALLLDKQ
jgi:hypothetical protein